MRRLLLSLLVLSMLPACIPQRDYIYFYKKNRAQQFDSIHKDIQVAKIPDHLISLGDVLEIFITSDISTDNIMMQRTVGNTNDPTRYVVPVNGIISVPLIGKINVANLFVDQLQDTLVKGLLKFYVNPFVKVSVISFNVSVIGEVKLPGMKQVIGDHVNLVEVISIAGDLSDDGKRTEVKVIREIDGKINMFSLDLASASIFNSPVFYLQSNDLVVVSPYKAKRNFRRTQQVLAFTSVLNSIFIITNLILSK